MTLVGSFSLLRFLALEKSEAVAADAGGESDAFDAIFADMKSAGAEDPLLRGSPEGDVAGAPPVAMTRERPKTREAEAGRGLQPKPDEPGDLADLESAGLFAPVQWQLGERQAAPARSTEDAAGETPTPPLVAMPLQPAAPHLPNCDAAPSAEIRHEEKVPHGIVRPQDRAEIDPRELLEPARPDPSEPQMPLARPLPVGGAPAPGADAVELKRPSAPEQTEAPAILARPTEPVTSSSAPAAEPEWRPLFQPIAPSVRPVAAKADARKPDMPGEVRVLARRTDLPAAILPAAAPPADDLHADGLATPRQIPSQSEPITARMPERPAEVPLAPRPDGHIDHPMQTARPAEDKNGSSLAGSSLNGSSPNGVSLATSRQRPSEPAGSVQREPVPPLEALKPDLPSVTPASPSASGQKIVTLEAAPDRVAALILELLERPTAPTPTPANAARAPATAVHTLAIALHPEHLGEIELRLRVRGGELTVELRAADTEVAKRIDAEKDKIVAQLREVGFDPFVTVHRSVEPGSFGSQPQGSPPGFARSGEGQSGPGAQARSDQPPREDDRPRYREEGKGHAETGRASSDAVYL